MSSVSPAESNDGPEYDPVFLHSRREAIVIFSIWLLGLFWAVPFCYWNGYGIEVDPENLSTVWGIPTWLFWGIAVPWLVADILTTWFCFVYMADDDLETGEEGADFRDNVPSTEAAEAPLPATEPDA